MAESDSVKTLSEQYLLKEKEEKLDMGTKPGVESDVKDPVNAAPEVAVTENPDVASVTTETDKITPTSVESTDAAIEATTDSDKDVTEAPPAVSVESSESVEKENSDDQEANEANDVTPEIKLETAPADFRFPTTNQSRHCFTRYVEYHRCIAAKGEGAPECDRFAKYYRSLCPGEWVDRWNEQRENGTFPGPL